MSCGSGSGALAADVAAEIAARKLVMAGVISSNRNFDGRLNAAVRGTFLASPPLVVAYAIAGSILHDLTRDSLGEDADGKPVFLADIWPGDAEIRATLDGALTGDLFHRAYDAFADPGPEWANIPHPTGPVFAWDPDSMYLRRPPFLDTGDANGAAIQGARILLMLGDDLTTDHISPGSAIPANTDAGAYLTEHGVPAQKFGTYIGRRANHEVMIRGTFANVRLRNELVPDREGGFTRHQPSGEVMTVFHAAERYRSRRPARGRGRRTQLRLRLVARLGGEGHLSARCPRGDRRKLRAHPPLQPRRHGRAAAAISARHDAPHAGLDRRRNVRHAGHCGVAGAWR